MIEIELPEAAGGAAVPLALRTTRGDEVAGPARLDDRLILGDPSVRRLLADTVGADDELRLFVADEAAHTSYWLVQFTCTFEHDDALPFTKAWLRLDLTSDGGKAVAHSMEPARQSTNRTVQWKATLTVPCVLVGLEVGAEHVTDDVFCEASAEGTARPAWTFYATRSDTIRGLQRLRLVVRTPVDGSLSAVASLGATALYERFGRKPLSYLSSPPPATEQPWLSEPRPAVGHIP